MRDSQPAWFETCKYGTLLSLSSPPVTFLSSFLFDNSLPQSFSDSPQLILRKESLPDFWSHLLSPNWLLVDLPLPFLSLCPPSSRSFLLSSSTLLPSSSLFLTSPSLPVVDLLPTPSSPIKLILRVHCCCRGVKEWDGEGEDEREGAIFANPTTSCPIGDDLEEHVSSNICVVVESGDQIYQESKVYINNPIVQYEFARPQS